MRHLFSWCIVWLTATITDAFSISQLPSFSSALGGSFAGSGATSVASVVAPAWASVTRASRRASAAVLMAADLPRIVQGGMGVQVSNWKLARAVARRGELGITSGTAMDVVLPRALMNGDPDGLYRKALATFPDQAMAQRCIDKYFIEGGKAKDKAYKPLGMWKIEGTNQQLQETTVMSNYAEIWLAKHNDDGTPISGGGWVGINCLTKIQMPTIHSLYGAMLAGCDYVIMGAGIPMEVPLILDQLAAQEPTKMAIDVTDSDDRHFLHFDPAKFFMDFSGFDVKEIGPLKRPKFIPIVASVLLAQSMLKRAQGNGGKGTKGIDGFVIEMPTAGGHNAPPRGFKYDAEAKSHALALNERGEPVYGTKDEVDLVKFRKAIKGLPFWMAGGYGKPEMLESVLAVGGQGIQVGTAFAFCEESGFIDEVKQMLFTKMHEGELDVYTDPVASPTGFPFKVVQLDDLSSKEKYENRPRVCNLGYLRHAYQDDKGRIGYRCAAEPVEDWIKKGGDISATVGRKCLCNALMADAGYPQISPFKPKNAKEEMAAKYIEEGLVTAGDDVNSCRKWVKRDEETGKWGYPADAVIDYLVEQFEFEGVVKQVELAAHREALNAIADKELALEAEAEAAAAAAEETPMAAVATPVFPNVIRR